MHRNQPRASHDSPALKFSKPRGSRMSIADISETIEIPQLSSDLDGSRKIDNLRSQLSEPTG
jgi:hypothetical protein